MAQSEKGRGTRRVTRTKESGSKESGREIAVRSSRTSSSVGLRARSLRNTAERQSVYSTRSDREGSARRIKNTLSARQAQSKRDSKKMSFRESIAKVGELDYTLLFLIILIVAFGLIVMLSASAPEGNSLHGNSYYFFWRQLLFISIGFVGMIIISRLNLDNYRRWIPFAFLACVVLLILVLIPGVGVEANGARRWLNIPLIQPQPSEFMKPVIAMFIADLVSYNLVDLKTLKGNAFCFAAIAIVAFLLMCETHLSGTIIIVGIAVCVMIAGGTPIKPLIIACACMGLLVFIYLQFNENRMDRVMSLFDPFADAQGKGYQISQSIYAIGSGKLFGLGLGQSVQKYSHLPEPYNDFIFSIVCEELGFFGGVIVIILFAALFLRAMRVAINAPDKWSSLTCIGIASQIGIQAFLNMGVAVSIIPNTGVSLPFFSYGGTSIMTLLFEMGILLNVSRKSIK